MVRRLLGTWGYRHTARARPNQAAFFRDVVAFGGTDAHAQQVTPTAKFRTFVGHTHPRQINGMAFPR